MQYINDAQTGKKFIKHDLFLDWLISVQLISDTEVTQIIANAQTAHISTMAALLQQKPAAGEISQQLATYLRLSWFDLGNIDVQAIASNIVSEEFIRDHRVLPFFAEDKHLSLAISEPAHLDVLPEIKFHTDLPISPVVVEWDKLSRLVDTYLRQLQYDQLSHFQIKSTHTMNDEEIVVMVERILQDAISKKSSDIHLEPYKTNYRLRFRIDGILHKITSLPIDLAHRLIARFKIMARLDIAERRLPQDGRFTLHINSQEAQDFRASICPTLFGEKIVVRLLDSSKTPLDINTLGLENSQQELFLSALRKPQGMVLVTGPTGSGKTVTLYTALNLINRLEKNICSVEDPVEIILPGINQVNINLKTDLTFAKILRAFLRQDPDVLMVGEIRDPETAETAIKAAQTGHLVLSTLHTNNAVDALNRLAMMGLSSFNTAQTIHLIIAQRLLRKLCHHCKQVENLDQALLKNSGLFNAATHLTLYKAVGCDHCIKGYNSRTGVFELLPITTEISQLIIDQKPAHEIAMIAKKMGLITLQEAALRKVVDGVTTLEEVQRVIL